MPKLSIVVPVYNVALFIRECLDSIKRQSFRDWECMLVDDGSTDSSGDICREFCAKDPRFRYFYQENSGVSSARNRGIERATGEFLTFVDPDDVLSRNFYEILFETQKKYDADVVEGATIDITESGEIGPIYRSSNFVNEAFGEQIFFFSGARDIVARGKDEVVKQILLNTFNCLSWNKIYRLSLWAGARYPENLSLGEDMAVVIGVVTKANVAATAPGAVYYYRDRHTSLLHSNVNAERLQEDLQGSAIMREQLLEIAPDRQEDIRALKLQYDIGCINQFVKQRKGGSRLAAFQKALSYMEEYKGIENPFHMVGAFYKDFVNVFLESDLEGKL
ncbi:MAG: glycosyltransferase [Lachnospiraceae bacterium]|nr:glycosyltransferase [Lachnospiraceae bacterium]